MPWQPTTPTRVFLVEDHPQMRQQIAAMIARERHLVVCGEAADAEAALSQIVQILPDLVLLDLSLKNSSGFDLLPNLQALYPDLPVLVLSMHEASLFGERALQAGARGYITKQRAIYDLQKAIRTVMAGQVYQQEIGNASDNFTTIN